MDEYVSHGGHAYRPDLRVAAFKWLNKYVKNDTTTPIKDAEFKQIPGKELRVFVENKDIPADQINTKIDETFVPKAKIKLPDEEHFAEWRRELIQGIREQSLRSLRSPVPVTRRWPKFSGGELITDQHITVFEHYVHLSGSILLGSTMVVFNPDEDSARWFKIKLLNKGDTDYYELEPRGSARSPWTHKSPPNFVERAHALLGTTVDEGRVRDIISVVRSYADIGTHRRLIGKGQAGVLAAYAALFEPTIQEVVIIDPPTSHKEGPYFPSILRVLDIPDALGLLAPNVRLTLINARDPAFDRTEAIYRLAGAADKFTRK